MTWPRPGGGTSTSPRLTSTSTNQGSRRPARRPLVDILRAWVDDHDFSGDDLLFRLFRTRTGLRPRASNWSRALHRAQEACGRPQLRVYDCRHAAATTWRRAGVPLGDVAKRMGHSVETLVSTYVGALEGDEALANERIDAALGPGTVRR